MGALIRISAAFGADAMILGERCHDPFWRQSVRVSMGTVCSMPLVRSENLLRDLAVMRERWRVQLVATVLADDLGRVWVPRARAHTDTIVVHDVFDASSRVVMRVPLPVARRIVGFGKGVVYTVRADEDDLLHLGRHKLP